MGTTHPLPGRLGNPEETLGSDPRTDPRLAAAIEPLGLGGHGDPIPVAATDPTDTQVEFCNVAEEGFQALFGLMSGALEPIEGVERSVETIPGADGNDVTLYVHRPSDAEGELPGILHIHGGGMVILTAVDPNYMRWRDRLASEGAVVIGVEYRNGAGKLGPHPFPAGLNDCSSALDWMHANRGDLGISKVLVSGESGGGNLTLATTLKARRDGRLDRIDGVYAQCPYISGLYASKPAELTSLTENDEYFIGTPIMGVMAAVYDPSGDHAADPLAWPYHADVAELAGLPPHVISVNELDPLRDEGLAYYRKLLAAGVPAVGRTVAGTCHAGDLIFEQAMPDVYEASVRDVIGFARSL